ncbi:hypothetical protein B4102_1729 [Heyndrickxia sporothermodurans]|uniref:Uncharacterized protein n=1 Tax=Heyndrickxia sporothermodurans TaxID=46224 RepID=A0A150LF01_9BACI|nr:hypothetical protein B4102_1729 [Heyndrickxia sporothermodurans]
MVFLFILKNFKNNVYKTIHFGYTYLRKQNILEKGGRLL